MIVWKKEWYTGTRVPTDGPPALWLAPNGKYYFQTFTENDMRKIVEESKKNQPQIALENQAGLVLTQVWTGGLRVDPENGDLRYDDLYIPEKWRTRITSFSLKWGKKRNGMLVIIGMRAYMKAEEPEDVS